MGIERAWFWTEQQLKTLEDQTKRFPLSTSAHNIGTRQRAIQIISYASIDVGYSGYSVVQTPDGGFAIAGSTYSIVGADIKLFILEPEFFDSTLSILETHE